jgi:perosamine synthetase
MICGKATQERFRQELMEYFGAKHCFLVSSGKAALTLILLALKQLNPDRKEVLLPAFTCYSVPSSVVRAGLRIRLCDLHPDNLDFDFVQLSAILCGPPLPPADDGPARASDDLLRRTRDPSGKAGESNDNILAVVPTHLFGIPVDVGRLRKLIRDPGVAIVEDAAQAMGETREARKAGTLGDVSFFSLGRGKAYSVVEGGVILTNRDDLAEVLAGFMARLPHYGPLAMIKLIVKAAALMLLIHPRLFWVPRSMPFLRLGETLFESHFPIRTMSSFQAGLARHWREKLETLRDDRKKKVKRWVGILEERGLRRSDFLDGQVLGLPRFPLRITDRKKRESLLNESVRMGMGIMPVYPDSINAIPELKGMISGAFPVAERCARELVTLPTHGFVSEDDITAVRTLISRVLG